MQATETSRLEVENFVDRSFLLIISLKLESFEATFMKRLHADLIRRHDHTRNWNSANDQESRIQLLECVGRNRTIGRTETGPKYKPCRGLVWEPSHTRKGTSKIDGKLNF
jgi:hypothetical protein